MLAVGRSGESWLAWGLQNNGWESALLTVTSSMPVKVLLHIWETPQGKEQNCIIYHFFWHKQIGSVPGASSSREQTDTAMPSRCSHFNWGRGGRPSGRGSPILLALTRFMQEPGRTWTFPRVGTSKSSQPEILPSLFLASFPRALWWYVGSNHSYYLIKRFVSWLLYLQNRLMIRGGISDRSKALSITSPHSKCSIRWGTMTITTYYYYVIITIKFPSGCFLSLPLILPTLPSFPPPSKTHLRHSKSVPTYTREISGGLNNSS